MFASREKEEKGKGWKERRGFLYLVCKDNEGNIHIKVLFCQHNR